MSPLTFVLLALAGGLGAALRLLVDGLVRSRVRVSFPLGTALVNVSGSLVLGFLVALAVGNILPGDWALILGGGLMGGYTTFSTASLETVRLAHDRRYLAALSNGVGTLLVSVAAAGLGLWAGMLLS